MKVALSLSLVLLMFAGVMTGCSQTPSTDSANDSTAATETADTTDTVSTSGASNAVHEFDFDGNTVRVEVDLSGGWGVEFGEMATYLYASQVDKSEAIAFGVYYDQKEYDAFVKEYKGKENFKEEKNAVTYKDETVAYRILKVKDGVYFSISTNSVEEIDALSQRFAVSDGGKASSTGKGTQARHLFNYDGTMVYVTVALEGGMSIEFGENATYIYQDPLDQAGDALAWGTYMDQEDYDMFVEDYSEKDGYTEKGEELVYDHGDGTVDYVKPLTSDLYYCITVDHADDPEAVTKLFTLELLDYSEETEEETEEEDSDDEEETLSDEEQVIAEDIINNISDEIDEWDDEDSDNSEDSNDEE